MPDETVYISPLEVQILKAFFNDLYLTSKEMAAILRTLADKLEK